MGKKSTKTKTTSTSAPPSWAVEPLKDAMGGVLDTYKQNQGNLTQLQGQLMGSVIPGLQSRINDTSMLQSGSNYANSVLGGKYLNSNPHTTAMAKMAAEQAGNAVNSTFSLAGRTGSDNHARELAEGTAAAANAVNFQNYQNERGLQNQAASMLPSYYQSQFAGYSPLLGASQLAGQMPYYGSQSLGTIGSLVGGYGTSTQTGKQPGGWGTSLLGGLLAL